MNAAPANPPAAAAGDDTFWKRPLLVYGPRKAGTTLLQSLLDGGSSILMVPDELKLKYMVRSGWPMEKPAARWFVERGRSFFPGLFRIGADGRTVEVNPGAGIAGVDRDQVDEILDLEVYASGLQEVLRDGVSDAADLIRADVRAFTRALRNGVQGAGCWASKEVGGDSEQIISLFLRCFPEGRVVYLVRQPEFIVRSVILDRRRKGGRLSLGKVLRECRSAQRVVDFGHRHALGNGVVVAYESLTENPAAVIGHVCRELGLEAESVHTGPTTFGKPVVVNTSSRNTTRVFRQENDWRKDLALREIITIRCFGLLGRLCHRLRGKRKIHYRELREMLSPRNPEPSIVPHYLPAPTAQ